MRLTQARSNGFNARRASRSCAKFRPAPSRPSDSRSSRSGATRSASGRAGGAPWPSPRTPSKVGSLVTTTTQSSKGTHMKRQWRWSRSSAARRSRASARVMTTVRSRSRCLGTHRSVHRVATPSSPRATGKASKSGSPRATSSVPRPGVTIRRLSTWPSTGGSDAPVPCAPTPTKPPICCCAMDARFSSVRPWGASASSTWSTRAPHCTVTVRRSVSTSRTLSSSARLSMPPSVRASPLGDSAEPHGRRRSLRAW
mmetsp:Transcript_12523/g.37234  ORF Transcript_12523/g.37234 Transcript_12523/m.37234 type:complete len:255 (+) Transcript_12523:365-1129(+)